MKRVLPAVANLALALPATASARWLFFAGVLVAVGISLYALLVLRRIDGAPARRVAIVLGVSAALAAVGAGLEAHRAGLDTRYGATMAGAFAVAGLVAVGAIAALRPALVLTLLAGVASVAVLVQVPPGRDHVPVSSRASALEPTPNPPTPPADAVVMAQEAGPLAVALEAEPDRLTAIVLSPAGGGMSGLRVRFLPSGVSGAPCGSGCYSAAVAAGRHVRVAVAGYGSPETASFTLPRHAPSAAGILRRYEAAYRARPGVSFDERLASSPTDFIDAQWRLEEPDRLAYVITGKEAAAGIVIGARRWDRGSAHGRWEPSPQAPRLSEPATQWEKATNAHVLSERGRWETVSFADPILGAFFLLTFDRHTLRPHVLHMTASAHFMTDRYVGFSSAREIRRPR